MAHPKLNRIKLLEALANVNFVVRVVQYNVYFYQPCTQTYHVVFNSLQSIGCSHF